MPKRPRSLMFARNEWPPVPQIVLLGLQHGALSVVFLFYAVMIAKSAGFTPEQEQSLLVGTLLAAGIGAMLQAGSPRFSSGLLIVPLAAPISMMFAIDAGREIGPGGIATLAVVQGIVQIFIGRVIRGLRAYLPPEICGLVVLVLGISMVPPAFNRMVGSGAAGGAAAISYNSIVIAFATIASIIASSIWLKGSLRLFSMAIGCVVGYLAAAATGHFDNFGDVVGTASWAALPHFTLPSLHLKLPFILAFAIIAVVSAIDDIGVLISADRLDDAAWNKPDMPQISRGVASFGAVNILSGIFGGTVLGFSSSNIGLAYATGVTSRIVGITAGVAMITISLFPKLLAVVAAMPEPVLGAILGYSASYFIVSGAELALSRMLSPRRILVVGLPIVAAVAVQVRPDIVAGAPQTLAIILKSPLIVASLLAVSLNALLRIGIAQKHTITALETPERHEQIRENLDELGEVWGLKRSTATQAATALNQLLEAVSELKEGAMTVELRHDDVNLDIRILYRGLPMIFPDKAPTPDELMNDPDGVSRMSGWLVRHLADRASSFVRDDRQGVMLRFES